MLSVTPRGAAVTAAGRRPSVARPAAEVAEVRSNDLPATLIDQPMPALAPVRTEQLYAMLSATNEAILRASSAPELYQRVCEAATSSGVIGIAAVMLPIDNPPGMLRPAASSGADPRGEHGISVDASRPEGRGLAGNAFHT